MLIDEIEKLPLIVKVKWATAVTEVGLFIRTAKRFEKTASTVSHVANGIRKNQEIKDYLNNVSSLILQTYLNNPKVSKDYLLNLENNV